MGGDPAELSRRSFLATAAGAAAALIGCSRSDAGDSDPRSSTMPAECPAISETGSPALWRTAMQQGIVFGSSAATWQLDDAGYRKLFAREAALLLTEDDLLWYRLKPSPGAPLDFTYGDRIVSFAERHGMVVIGAHLVWDEGFGDGWTDDDLWDIGRPAARRLLFDTVEGVVARYRDRVAGWIVANEVVDGGGLRTDVPWHETIGPSTSPTPSTSRPRPTPARS